METTSMEGFKERVNIKETFPAVCTFALEKISSPSD